jgi:uncharacterized protein
MPSERTNSARDARAALVFDLRSLSRQAGSARTVSRVVPAPADLRLELAGVPAGADVELTAKFEAVSEGVLATVTATAPVEGECARCLGPVATTVTVSIQELYLYNERQRRRAGGGVRGEDELELNGQDADEERYLDGDLLDLEPAFRDAVVLALPMSPLCREDCPGLCIDCGVPLAEAGPSHGHGDALDPRWAGLKNMEPLEPKES